MQHFLRLLVLAVVALNVAALSFRTPALHAASPAGPSLTPPVTSVAPAPSTAPAARAVSPLLAAFDADRDGRLSPAEIANATHLLRLLDANGDGILTADEFPRQ